MFRKPDITCENKRGDVGFEGGSNGRKWRMKESMLG